jgi:2-C-methyl-D-erythritol 2,4-cyclodiphosphate synthase
MSEEKKIRVGIGYDIHPFVPGRRLFLGGVEIYHPLGLEGVSDADVLIHALIDAILGATSLGDIGKFFPPDDPSFKDISSVELLKRVVAMIGEKGFRVLNADLILITEAPKMSGFSENIKEKLSEVLGIPREDVGFKAKTSEGIGPAGKGVCAEAFAVVLVEKLR